MEPSSTGLGGLAALKVAMAYGIPAAIAAILGLLIMPPRTAREFTVRSISTVSCSFLFGPAVAAAVIAWKPSLMEAMTWLAQHGAGSDDALLAKFYVLGPSMLIAGLPAWWVLGAYVRWMASMRQKGLLEWVAEARAKLFGVRPGGEG
ncbi:hypothetical protein E2544_08875 [Achromobacter insolitus]|uniref:hypothetical protein n=1 Tax=Achromobacter TaxID=222 RepID=UPI0011EB1DE7|nr:MULTISPECIES: hypothetical protein [Achromobacter]MEB3098847.1 hypothetical protein [Achromobacter sp. D10]QEK91916.1 hypothetical protein E2544_08875 [Achromobacter insolitus]GLK92392.1 hypothetical protein GCM10008164_01280 [Achromobacter xylosoxidans]